MIVLVAATLGGGGGGGSSTSSSHRTGDSRSGHPKAHTPKAYVIENGDTLTSIAHKTGVPVATILKLNPGIDPQILISGEKLRLR
ncbi:MAG TPA: LysM domain-containing protein [Solirubrobacterales bacterium]|nr:LysM domain-containing protein [Solirubrobacterales bacterium]